MPGPAQQPGKGERTVNDLSLAFIIALFPALLIGLLAEKWKRRFGIGWAFITFAITVAGCFFMVFCLATQGSMELMLSMASIFGAGTSFVIMFLVVATLQKKQRCHFCKASIPADAIVCSRCQREQPVEVRT